MRIAGTEDLEVFSEPAIVDTPAHFEEGMRLLVDQIREMAGGKTVAHIVGGVPGTLLPDGSGLLLAPHLPDWVKQPMRERLKAEFGGEVTLVNDSGLVAMGEATHGAGKDSAIVVYFTFSTGVGGARVTNGLLDEAAYSFEPGKLVVSGLGGEEPRTLESYASGTWFTKNYHAAPKDVHDEKAWDDAARAVARGVHTAMLYWSPHTIVLGGPMVLGEPAIPWNTIEREAKKLLGERQDELNLKKAELGALGGLWGGMALLRRSL